jgi:hypothetical protein
MHHSRSRIRVQGGIHGTESQREGEGGQEKEERAPEEDRESFKKTLLFKLTKVLLKAGADVNATDKEGYVRRKEGEGGRRKEEGEAKTREGGHMGGIPRGRGREGGGRFCWRLVLK